MSSDKIQEAKSKFLNSVKPKYIELYGALEPDLLFIDKSLFDENSVVSIDAEIIFVDEPEHIAFHCKNHISNIIAGGSDGSSDVGYGLSEPTRGLGKSEYIFYDVFCDFEIKAYMKQSWQPEWRQAPEWANWWCMEKSGDAFWFYEKPIKSLGDGWTLGGGSDLILDAPAFDYHGNWQDSLRSRDKQHF